MSTATDVDADVVEECSHLQQEPFALAETVILAEFVEQPRRQHGDVPTMRPIKARFLSERVGAGKDLPVEVGGVNASCLSEVEQQSGSQRRISNHDAFGSRLGQKRAVDKQRRHEFLFIHRRQEEPLDVLLLVKALKVLTKVQKCVAINLVCTFLLRPLVADR